MGKGAVQVGSKYIPSVRSSRDDFLNPNRCLNMKRLTEDFYDMLDGIGSPLWSEFEDLMVEAFRALRAHTDEIVKFVAVSEPTTS